MKFNFQFFIVYTFLFICVTQSQLNYQRRGKYVAGRNIDHSSPDNILSRTQTIRLQERQLFKQISLKVPLQTAFQQFIFSVQGVQQFILNLPVSQSVAFSLQNYVMQENTYISPMDIDNQVPVKVYVFQNNNKIIHQSQFYFQNYVVFEGLQHSTYTIRFINSEFQRIVSMQLKRITQLSHVQRLDKDKQKVYQNSIKVMKLQQQLKYLFHNFNNYSFLNQQYLKNLLNKINLYYYWQIIQAGLAFSVCIMQIVYIKKICRQQIIV